MSAEPDRTHLAANRLSKSSEEVQVGFLTEQSGCASREEFWQAVQQSIKDRLGLERFSIWFRQTELMRADEQQLVVGVPNVIIQQFLTAQYTDAVAAAVEELVGKPVQVSFDVAPRLFRQMRARQSEDLADDAERSERIVSFRSVGARVQTPAGWGFEHLIVTRSNRLPFAAARELAGQENPRFRFLYVCGGYGLGKSALLRAMHALASGGERGLDPVYVAAEDWCNEYYHAIQRKTTHVFRNRYRACGLLLVDDIQFIQGKAAGQREMLHTVKHVLAKGGRVALGGLPQPDQLADVSPDLLALLRSAFPAVLLPPQEDELLDIVAQMAMKHKLDADEEVLRYLARESAESFAVMESAICRLALFAGVEGCGKVRLADVRRAFADVQPGGRRAVDVNGIIEAVVSALPVTVHQLRSGSRRRTVSQARQVAAYLARRLTGASLSEIGASLGGLTHSSVKYAADRIAAEREGDPALCALLNRLEAKLTGRDSEPAPAA